MTTLRNEVKEILEGMIDDDYDMGAILRDLVQEGCQSGMIGGLIYYSDTKKFYERHEEEIENMLDQIDYDRHAVCGDVDFSLKTYCNNAAWIAFEMVALSMAGEQ
jgi:hypothetical protein